MTRIFKLRGFARFQRKEQISDVALRKAVAGAEQGLVHADLGGGLVKQRLARKGQGKSSGYRTVIAIRRGDLAVFLYGFAKNERSNIDGDELEELRRLAHRFLGLTAEQIDALIAENELTEILDDEAG